MSLTIPHLLLDTERGRLVIRAAKRALAAREEAKTLIASVSDVDRNRFHELAAKAGGYLKSSAVRLSCVSGVSSMFTRAW
jgi:hypothetical protein